MTFVLEKATKAEKQTRIKSIDKETRDLERQLETLMAEDRTNYAQGIINKIFTEFAKGGKWTARMKELSEKEYYVFSPFGRKRNLFAAMTEDKEIVARQVRRGSNAPIQGMASEIGVKAGRVVMKHYYRELPKLCKMLGLEYSRWSWRVLYNRMVHDANYYSVPFEMVIPYIHILQWGATYGITRAYKKEFDIQFTVEPEIEIEVGSRDDMTNKWDWSLPNIVSCITKSIDDLEAAGQLDRPKDEVMKTIFRPWAKKEMRRYLQEKYPLLNVKDLDREIRDAIKPVYRN